ncbi:MAG TPA: patatin-like protein [Bryobacteraceae bacterium]|nr:patatin-like protein [Bryobacteraceae bacterium]
MTPDTPVFENEVRFALVLYGGASLAIYIHGVTQEFFHLVRSTAVDAAGNLIIGDAELSGTERVYRKLASTPDGALRTRFLVDIASGTSAGGINAIFLAKAFANGQTLDQVSRLWLDQADFQELLNHDKIPHSLLSSQTMHSRLLDALAGMESAAANPLQPEMDVFITTTDIQGLELPIELADKTVFETRHKNVFHLRFGTGENHFAGERNPFLAFAARATSAFPFAFEPASIQDGGAAQFFPDYVTFPEHIDGYAGRAFGDGGYLDNKPFTHAIQALSQRGSDLPVARKLMYVEPSPDERSGNQATAPPNFLRNTLDALVTLPRQETIREDLQRVIERNRLIERVQEITSHVEEDVREFVGRVGGAEYQRRTLADEIRDRGPGYAGYHRLKVRAVTDDLAAMLGQPSGAVDIWRREHFSEQDPERSESRFLLQFDLAYRERRLGFLLRKLTDPSTKRELNRIAVTLKNLRRPGVRAEAIADRFREVLIRASADAEACLDPNARRLFDQFEYYDQIVFPIFYEASVGEAEVCEVFRISPRDAISILDENAPAEKRRKLAGTALFHFGAFLNREWRRNDLLWGRLDAAERIVRAILPRGSPAANALIGEANLMIAGSAEALQRLRETYEVDRRLPVFTRLKLGVQASRTVVKMLAGYFVRRGQSGTK